MESCTHEYLFNTSVSIEDKCYIAQCYGENCCSEYYEVANFYSIVYCYLGGMWYLFLPFLLIAIFLSFRFVSGMVEEYLAPSVAYISEWLKFSETLGGVTLLALANGAGDVVTALVAIDTKEGVSYNIGALFGAGLFVCSFVVAATIMLSPKPIQLEPASIWRDVGIYILAALLFFVFAYQGELTLMSSIMMLGLYSMLVVVVLVQERMEQKDEKAENLVEKELENVSEDDVEKQEKKQAARKNFQNLVGKALLATKKFTKDEPEKKKTFYDFSRYHTFLVKYNLHQEKRKDDEEENGVMHYVDLVYEEIWTKTLPTCDPEHFDRDQCVFFPLISVTLMIFFLCFNPSEGVYWEWWWGYIGISVGVVLCCIFHSSMQKDIKEPTQIYIVIQLMGTIIALIYTDFMCAILIDILNFIGFVSYLSSTYLGLTIIAIGNALPDAATTMALSKKGYALMGMTGAYAGQLFGLLVGFGLAMLKKTLKYGPIEFDLLEKEKLQQNLLDIMVIIVILIALVYTFIVGVLNKYLMTKSLAYVLFGIYGVFFLCATIIAIYQAIGPKN